MSEKPAFEPKILLGNFYRICEKINDTIPANLEKFRPQDIRAEMRRIWGQAQDHTNWGSYGDFPIKSILFLGVFPVVVFAGIVYVAKKIQTTHDGVLNDNSIPPAKAPLGGFLWPLRFGKGGVYEPDNEYIPPELDEQIIEDKKALSQFLLKEELEVIRKAEYEF